MEPAALAGSALGCGVGGAQSPVREWEGPREARGEGQSQGAGRGGVGEKTGGSNRSVGTTDDAELQAHGTSHPNIPDCTCSLLHTPLGA